MFDEIRSWVIEVSDRIESGVGGGDYEGDALAVGAKELEAAVGAGVDSGGERVVVDQSGGDGSGDDVGGVGGGGGGVGVVVGADVAEGDAEVGVVVEVG